MIELHKTSRTAAGWAVRLALAVGLLGLLVPTPAPAQFFPQQDDGIPDVLATFESRIEPADARPGEHVRLIITGKITDGWYTYSAVPQGEFAPPPTKLFAEPGPFELLGPMYETNPTVKKDKVFDLDLAFHTKAARFYQNMRVPEGAAEGRMYFEGKLRFQVCNNKLCTPPRREPINVGIMVKEGPVRPAFAYMQRTIDYLDRDGKFKFSADSLQSALSEGLGAFLLLAVGFGLLSLLTPCVFPMIPITVSFFTGEAKRSQRSVLNLALLFAAGIVVAYTGLGLLLTFLVGAGGVSQFATSPWINLAVAGFFALFAFSLMGLYEFALPASWAQGLDRKSRVLKGPAGVLLMGLAFTATSFTCTMPFVGTLLIAATQGELFWPLIGMLVFSTVFAVPFFLLALFPRFVVSLRGKSGNWLVQLKVALGLIELMAALKFVSNADLIWQWGIFTREVTLALWAGLAALTALMLLGLLPWPGVKGAGRALPRQLFGGAFVVLTVYLMLGVTGRELDAYTEAYVPPRLVGASAYLTAGGSQELDKVHKLPWLFSLQAGLSEAKVNGKPIFIDFTGYTCVNCRWMEKNVFADPAVYDSFKSQFVLVQLYTDGGDNADINQNLQIERFRTVALPYYVILAPDNSVLAKHAGIMATPAEFLTWLGQGRAQLAKSPPARPCGVAGASGGSMAKC
ncbi:MAG: thioredoxin family protein [SAR324 cluster bacterium]|nr:thioredoxin family protein [SAR324 cluster bacterium]